MKTLAETRAHVYDLDKQAKARFDQPTDSRLRALAWRAVVVADVRPHDADTLRRLIASCDRDIYAETVAALGHDPLATQTVVRPSGTVVTRTRAGEPFQAEAVAS